MYQHNVFPKENSLNNRVHYLCIYLSQTRTIPVDIYAIEVVDDSLSELQTLWTLQCGHYIVDITLCGQL